MRTFSLVARFFQSGFSLLFALVFLCEAKAESSNGQEDSGLAAILNFETGQTGGMPSGWHGGPAGTVTADDTVVHEGKWSAKLERDEKSQRSFSTLTKSLPMDFQGATIEIRGFLKTENVTDFVGLWLREDDESTTLEFDNMQSQQLKGTTDWKEYSVTLHRNSASRRLVFGVLLAGTGKAWADDLQLLVDGKPIWEAPKIPIVDTVLDTDHEFDGGSRIKCEELSKVQVKDLATLCKVWGLLKYYHPRVTSGKIQWDYELFRIMPQVLAAKDETAADVVMLGWISRIGDAGPGEDRVSEPVELYMGSNNAWIRNRPSLGRALSERLIAIDGLRFKGESQFYVTQAPGVGNPEFLHELSYPNLNYPDAGYQLLGLFRFWNIIRFWYPYRDLVGSDWDPELEEFISRIALARDAKTYQLELMALIARVRDTHANLWSSIGIRPPTGEGQLPVDVRFVEGKPIITRVLSVSGSIASNFEKGDELCAIDGVTVGRMMSDWLPYYAASNEPTKLRDFGKFMGRGPIGSATVEIRRGGAKFKILAQRIAATSIPGNFAHDREGSVFSLIEPGVGYLKLSSVKANDAASYIEQARGTKSLIIDIRNYPSEFVVFALGDHLVEAPTDFARFTVGSLSHPGAFSFGPPVSLRPESPHYGGRIVLLVDEVSQSQAEYTTMAFRSVPGAVVIGSQTAGADGNVSKIPLPGGFSTMISGIGVFYPNKIPTQRVGIVPDIVVEPTIAGIRAGRDEILERAIEELRDPISSTDRAMKN